MKYSFKYVVSSLPKSKSSVSSFWVKLVARPLSFPLTWLFANCNVSANAVSVLSGIVSVIGCVLLSLPFRWSAITGIILINLWIVLDCVDGNVARVTKKSSRMGEFFDATYGYIICAFDFLAIGIAAYNWSNFIFGERAIWNIIIGALACSFNILPRLIYQKYTVMMMDLKYKEQGSYEPENDSFYKPEQRKGLTYFRLFVDRQIGTSGLFMPFLIVCCVFNLYSLMSLFYCCYLGFSCIATIVLFSIKASKVK